MPTSRKSTKAPSFREPATFESEVLGIVAFEFGTSRRSESDRKIRRRLRDKKLGPFDPTRVERLRTLKDDIQAELAKHLESQFYKSQGGRSMDLGDWRIDDLHRYFVRRHQEVAPDEIARFLPYAIYLYYLR